MKVHRFVANAFIYIGAGILLGALSFYITQARSGLLSPSPTPAPIVASPTPSPTASPTSTSLSQVSQ